MNNEIDEYLKVALGAAWQAGEFMEKNFGKSIEIEHKRGRELVTEVDRQSEKLLVDVIRGKFPPHTIISEEGMGKKEGEEYVWYIDPLDGTTNYAHGFPFFCISIGLQIRGEMKLALIYDPLRKETFTALKGEGAFCNNQRITVSKTDKLRESLLATGFPYDLWISEENNIDYFNRFLFRSRAIRRAGSAALDLSYVACGRFDGFWELKLRPWDVAAGSLLVVEAGGVVSNFGGGEFTLYGKQILATNGRIHREMVEVLQT